MNSQRKYNILCINKIRRNTDGSFGPAHNEKTLHP